MPGSKKWCAHPTRHINDTKIGKRPSHPQGHHPMSAQIARNIQTQYCRSIGMKKTSLKEGDRLCTTCFYRERARFDKLYSSRGDSMDMEYRTIEDSEDSIEISKNISENLLNEDSEDNDDDNGDDSFYPPEEERKKNKQTLNTIFELLGISAIADMRNTQVLQQKVDDAYVKMRMLCNSTIHQEQDSKQSDNSKLSVTDSDALIEGLQTLFKHSSNSEKIRLLTIAPVSWGRNTIVNFFNCTEHQARAAIELRITDGIFAYPASLRGNQPADPDIIEKVVNFYRNDSTSRPSANRKDVVSINGKPMNKKFMQMTTLEAYRLFSLENPSLKIGKSKFYELRPKDVKLESPHDVCLCIYHENMSLLIKAWNVNTQSNVNINDLMESVVCDLESEECCSGDCINCSSRVPSLNLMEGTTIDEEEEISWTIWKTINNKMMLQTVSGLMLSLLSEIDDRWSIYVQHAFINRQQRKYIETIREQSSADDCIVVQIDFAENYKFVRQREPQGAHWNTDQATLFTIHFKIGTEHRCMVIISDYMNHDSKFVWLAQENIVSFLKKHYPRAKKINYVSDGAASHFKNNYTIMNLLYHKKDFDIDAVWTFSATAHGKGPCDGIGATVKAIATRASLQGQPNTNFQTALDFWSFIFDKNDRSQSNEPSPIECCFLPKEIVEKRYREKLENRWKAITSSNKLQGIRKYHQFEPQSDKTISCRTISLSTHLFNHNY